MNRSASTHSLLPVSHFLGKEYVFMHASAAGLCQDHRTKGLGSTGAIVLSASCRLLFIDRNAIGLLDTLDSEWLAPTEAQPLPPCLMAIVQEIAVHPTLDKCPDPLSAHRSRFLGPRSQPIRVQGFLVPRHEQRERRFVLVLSRSNPAQWRNTGSLGRSLAPVNPVRSLERGSVS